MVVCVYVCVIKSLCISMRYMYRWRGGATRKAFGLAISRSRVQILLEATLRNNLKQVVYTYVPLSPSSITCLSTCVESSLANDDHLRFSSCLKILVEYNVLFF